MQHDKKTLIQCDFDGTITTEDEAFILLNAFADGNWREVLDEYKDGKISVGAFNSRAFAMVKADEKKMLELVNRTLHVRPGFTDFISHCRQQGFRPVIVSNGLDFYIKAIMKKVGVDIEVFAAKTSFDQDCMKVKYLGPNGEVLDDSFKEAYTRSFLGQGYRVMYIGNGPSDMPAAKLSCRIFATGGLLELCRETNINCVPFEDFCEVVSNLN